MAEPRWDRWRVISCLGLGLLLGGCSTRFDETYYVGVYDTNGKQPLQFYRFRMRGTADFGSKVKFESGWYPAAALEFTVGENRTLQLFPTTQPASKGDGKTGESSSKDGSGVAPQTLNRVFIVGPQGRTEVLANQRLVLFMATDPSPITSTIQAFSHSLDVAGTAAILAHRESRRAASVERRRVKQAKLRALHDELNKVIGDENVKSFLNVIAIPMLDPETQP